MVRSTAAAGNGSSSPLAGDRGADIPAHEEPTLLDAIWQRRGLVAGAIVAAVVLAFVYSGLRPATWVARATLLVRDPRTISASPETAPNPSQAERYVADQVELLRSPRVIQVADELLRGNAATQLTSNDLASGTTVIGSRESNVIEVNFRASEAGLAKTGVDTILNAYQRVRKDDVAADYTSALERIDSSIASVDARLKAIAEETSQGAEGPGAPKLDQTLAQSVDELVRLLQQSPGDPAVRDQLGALQARLQAVDLIGAIEARSPQAAALQQEQARLIDRRAELATQRDEIAVAAELASGGVTLPTPEQITVIAQESSRARTLALGLVVGALAGSGYAYAQALRKHSLRSRLDPSAILGAPLLADVPDFHEDGVPTGVPVRDAAGSAAARAFQVAATSLEIVAADRQVMAVVSGSPGQGSTTTVANLALAAAGQGRRVLAVDADCHDPALTRALTAGDEAAPALPDVSAVPIPWPWVARRVPVDGTGELILLSVATDRDVVPASLFRDRSTARLFRSLRRGFEMILIDVPPLSAQPYAGLAAQQADAVLPVVAHDSTATDFEALVNRLGVLKMPTAGYIYTRPPSPSWRERTKLRTRKDRRSESLEPEDGQLVSDPVDEPSTSQ